MTTRVLCSWCDKAVTLTEPPTWCPHCRHRADVSRSGCTCPRCLEAWRQAGGTVLRQIADAVTVASCPACKGRGCIPDGPQLAACAACRGTGRAGMRWGEAPPAREEEVGGPELRGVAEAVLAWLERERHEHGPEGERLRRLLADALGRAEGG
jgi:hypothetical protein